MGKLIVCDETSLLEAIHTALDANMDAVVGLESVEVVVGANWLWNGVVGELHELWRWEGGVEIKIRDIGRDKACAWGGNDTVDEEFGEDEIGCWCGSGTIVGDTIATNCKTNSVSFSLKGANRSNDMAIGDGFGSWNGSDGDESDGVCACGGVIGTALGQSSEFIGICS